MPKIKYRFSLSQEERDELYGLVAKEIIIPKVLNALILLNYDEGAPGPENIRRAGNRQCLANADS